MARPSSCGEPATWSFSPTAISTGTSMAASCSRVRFARHPHAGRQRLEIAAGLLGELAVGGPGHGPHVGGFGRLEGRHDHVLAAHAVDQRHADAADDQRAHRRGVVDGEKRPDPAPHRIAHHVGAAEAQVIDQVRGVPGEQPEPVHFRVVELGALPVAADVHGDHPPPGPLQGVDPAGGAPVDDDVGGEAVDEEDRLAVALVEVGDVDAVGGEMLDSHGRPYSQ